MTLYLPSQALPFNLWTPPLQVEPISQLQKLRPREGKWPASLKQRGLGEAQIMGMIIVPPLQAVTEVLKVLVHIASSTEGSSVISLHNPHFTPSQEVLSSALRCLQCGRPRFDPWVGKISWRRKQQPTPILLPGESHGWRSLVGYSPWGRKESDTTEQLHFHFHFPFPSWSSGGLCASTVGGPGLIPSQRTRLPQTIVQPKKKKERKWTNKAVFCHRKNDCIHRKSKRINNHIIIINK